MPVGVEKLQQPPVQKPPLHIPFALGLLNRQGQSLPITLDGKTSDTVLLELVDAEQPWVFKIGRASCREIVCKNVEISVDADKLKKTNRSKDKINNQRKKETKI